MQQVFVSPLTTRRTGFFGGTAGIKPDGVLTLQVLRKNCILNWARINRNPKVTQELAGHADLATTMTYYSRVGDDAKTQAANEIDALLSDNTDARLTPET